MKKSRTLCCFITTAILAFGSPAVANAFEYENGGPNTNEPVNLGYINRITDEGKEYLQTEEYAEKLAAKKASFNNKIDPQYVILENQLEFNWYTQENGYYCTPACAQIMCEVLTGVTYSQDYLASIMGTTPEDGTYVDAAANVLYDLCPGWNITLSSNTTEYFYPNLMSNINVGCPVILTVDPFYFDIGYDHCGHSVLGVGYQEDLVSFFDPYPTFSDIWMCDPDEMSTALNAFLDGYYIW